MALIEASQNLAFATALSILGDRHRAQDATQDALIIAFERLHRLQNPEAFVAWMRGIVRRCALRIRRRVGSVKHSLGPENDPQSSEQPSAHLERQELRDTINQALQGLPERKREVIWLYYLNEGSQADVARALQLSVSQVNNLLHAARAELKKGLKDLHREGSMSHTSKDLETSLAANKLPQRFSEPLGQVISVRGPIVEASLEHGGDAFEPFVARRSDGQVMARMRLIQRLGDGRARFIVMGSEADRPVELSPGQSLSAGLSSALRPSHPEVPLEACLEALSQTPKGGLIETGIKALDLFAPLTEAGFLGLFGTQGVGRIVFERELTKRLARAEFKQHLLYFALHAEAGLIQRLLTADFEDHSLDISGSVETVWMLHAQATDADFAHRCQSLDARLVFDPWLAMLGLYPAIDARWSSSRLRNSGQVTARHADLANDAQACLTWYRQQFLVESLYEKALQRSHGAFKEEFQQRLRAQLNSAAAERAQRLKRARRLELFLTQPFEVAEPVTGMAGVSVSLAETLDGVEAILAGDCDDWDEAKLRYRGRLQA